MVNVMDLLTVFVGLGICIGISYIFMRGLLGILYEIANWVVHILD